jgi:hypothetical protein
MRGIDGLKNGSPLGVEPKGEGINGKTGFSISGQANEVAPVAPQTSDPKKAEKAATPEKKDSNSGTTGEAVGAKSTKVNGPLPAPLAWRTGLVALAQPVLIP